MEEASFHPTSCIYVQTVINERLGKIGWMHSWDGVFEGEMWFLRLSCMSVSSHSCGCEQSWSMKEDALLDESYAV
jgi:hypothetical protein